MKLKISTSKDAVKDVGAGGSFISNNGIYPVTIKFVSLKETKNGAVEANFTIDYNGNSQTIYGMTIQNTDGNPNEIGMSLLNKLGVIAGMEDGDDLDIDEEIHAVGKDQKETAFECITNFSDLECFLRVQREYTKWNGEVRRNLVIRNAFRTDTASANEIVSDSDIGKQYALELEKYSSTSAYRDGVTPEEAEAWEEAQRNKSKNDKATASAGVGAVTKKRTSVFGKK